MKKRNILLPPSEFHTESESNLCKFGIYCIYFNHAPNKFYIGSASIKGGKNMASKGFWSRWSLHLSKLKLNKHHSKHLQNTYNKYGKTNIKFKILEVIEDLSKLIEKEQYWMNFYDSYKNGYNCTPFANVGRNNAGILNKQGKKVYQFNKCGQLLAIYCNSREANRQTGINYKMIHKCCIGKTIFYKETTWRFSESGFNDFRTFTKIDVRKKVIEQYDLQGNFIKRFNTITEAYNETKITLSNISMCLRGQRTSAGKYLWKQIN